VLFLVFRQFLEFVAIGKVEHPVLYVCLPFDVLQSAPGPVELGALSHGVFTLVDPAQSLALIGSAGDWFVPTSVCPL
jgi:hypothetical protein